ncbi:MAG: hypothetical protein ACOC3V_05145 [bacterium]
MKYRKVPVDIVFEKQYTWIGDWCSDDKVTPLDDVAYYLYLKAFVSFKKLLFATQEEMIYIHNNNNYNFSDYYNKANLLLRKSKINKVLKNG